MKYLLENEESERIHFKKSSISHFEDWLAFYEDPSTSIHWNAVLEEPLIECQKWFDKQQFRYDNDLGGMNALIEKETGKLIGFCGLLIQTVDELTEMEIGYSLLPKFWYKGYATEAAKKCMDFAFTNNFAESLISIISLSNKPSENVARKNGMTIEKTTVYRMNDVNIFRIEKSKWKSKKD